MRTITYQIRHWANEDTGAGDCFEVMEIETIHATTGDEQNSFGIASFGTRDAAKRFIFEITSAG